MVIIITKQYLVALICFLSLLTGCGRETTSLSSEDSHYENEEPWQYCENSELSFSPISKENAGYGMHHKHASYFQSVVTQAEYYYLDGFDGEEQTWYGNYEEIQYEKKDNLDRFSLDCFVLTANNRHLLFHMLGYTSEEDPDPKAFVKSIVDYDENIYYYYTPHAEEDLYSYESHELVSPKGIDMLPIDLTNPDNYTLVHSKILEYHKYGEGENIQLELNVQMDCLKNRETILSDSLYNIFDIIQKQGGSRYDRISYIVFSEIPGGPLQTVLSFSLDNKQIEQVKALSEYDETKMKCNISDLWTFEKLLNS